MKLKLSDVTAVLPQITEWSDLLNSIRNDSSFANNVPVANLDNIAQFGQGVLANQNYQNEFISALVDRIGLVLLVNKNLQNPLAKFKQGVLPMGSKIEEIYTDLIPENLYDADLAESEVFKRVIPDVKVLFHELNRKVFFKSTVQDQSLKQAFVSYQNFENFISSIVGKLYDSNQVAEFVYMKNLFHEYDRKGLFRYEQITPVINEATGMEFVSKAREMATLMTLASGSRDFNSLAVHTVTNPEDLHLIMDAKMAAKVDVQVLARAFNIDYAKFIGNVTVIDKFANPNMRAVMIDREFFKVFDNDLSMESIRNPQGKYWNYFYHAWQVMSASRFANAVAFVEGDVPAVTQVIVSPPVGSLKKGRSMQYHAYVRQTDDNDYPVTWSIATTGVASGTTISADGVLTIADAETVDQIVVQASVTFDNPDYNPEDTESEETIEVVGQAIVIPY